MNFRVRLAEMRASYQRIERFALIVGMVAFVSGAVVTSAVGLLLQGSLAVLDYSAAVSTPALVQDTTSGEQAGVVWALFDLKSGDVVEHSAQRARIEGPYVFETVDTYVAHLRVRNYSPTAARDVRVGLAFRQAVSPVVRASGGANAAILSNYTSSLEGTASAASSVWPSNLVIVVDRVPAFSSVTTTVWWTVPVNRIGGGLLPVTSQTILPQLTFVQSDNGYCRFGRFRRTEELSMRDAGPFQGVELDVASLGLTLDETSTISVVPEKDLLLNFVPPAGIDLVP